MTRVKLTLAATALAGVMAVQTSAALAVPSAGIHAATRAPAGTVPEQVRWRGRGVGIGIGAGIIGGAIIGSALAAPYYHRPYYYYPAPRVYYPPPPVVYRDDSHAYCFSRFRSYDPVTRTYLGYDGYRHACP